MSAEIEHHSIAANAAISNELVRLTLGQRGPSRPELLSEAAQRLAALAQSWARMTRDFGASLVPVLSKMVRAAADMEATMRKIQQTMDGGT